ncbi:MAG: RDD family protein [Deltaproteobacteria bacterium]|nr:MAG: RDD family protein [Deltaproteobacteria bacterium]
MVTAQNRADLTTRFLAFAIDMIIYAAIFYGLGGLGHFLAMIYIIFRDGLFGGQSIGKKIMGIKVTHVDGRKISFVDSSFRNILFIFYILIPFTIVLEGIFLIRHPEKMRIGDRIAKTVVVKKEEVEEEGAVAPSF